MKYWLRMGGPNGITFRSWIIIAPVSVAFTWVVAPEGYVSEPNPWLGFLVGAIAHVLTGIILLLGKYTVLRNAAEKPRPLTTLTVFFIAGAARGLSVAYFMEFFQFVDPADYADRMLAGGLLVLIWFAISAVMVDGERQYKATYEELANKLATQEQIKSHQNRILRRAQENLLAEIKAILTDTLRTGKSTGQITESVDKLVRPLAHRLISATKITEASTKAPPQRIRLGPVIQTALGVTAYSPLWTILMAVLATLYSKLWQFGISALLDSILSALAIWLIFTAAKKLKLYGLWVIPIWIFTGLAVSSITALISGNFTINNLPNMIYLSVNVVVPAAIVAAIGAFDRNTEKNLTELRDIANRVSWEAASLKQRAEIEQQRIARFVHSELQSRLRAFAMRLDFTGRSPSEKEILELKEQCEAAFPLERKQRMFQDFIVDTMELWDGVADIRTDIKEEALTIISSDSYASSALEEICKEAILNSIRHGGAKNIEVLLNLKKIADDQMVLQLDVIDDGNLGANPKTGMGLSQIDQLSISHALTSEGGRTRLTAEVTCSPTLVSYN